MAKYTLSDETTFTEDDSSDNQETTKLQHYDSLKDCKNANKKLEVISESGNEEFPVEVLIENTQPSHLYGVNDIPPFLTCILSALQHALMSISNSFSITFILAELVCAGNDESFKTELMSSTLFVSGIATFLQNTIGIRYRLIHELPFGVQCEWNVRTINGNDLKLIVVSGRLPLYQGPAVEYMVPLLALSDSPEWSCKMAIDAFNQTGLHGVSSNVTGTPREVIHSKIQSLQGSLMLVSVLHIFAGASGLVGKLSRAIGPVTIVPVMLLFGFYVFRTVVKFSEPQFAVALGTASIAIILSLYLRSYQMPLPYWTRTKGFHIIRSSAHNTFGLLIAIVFGWITCGILTAYSLLSDNPQSKEFLARTDSKTYVMYSAPWIYLPYPGCFGFSLSLSASTMITFFVAMIASNIDSLADYHACSKIAYAPPPPKHAVNRGVFVEGIASFIAGAIGIGHGTNSYGGNIGAIGITRVASRRVFQFLGIIYIVFGMLGKLSAFFVTIPFPVLGGIQLIYFGSFIGIVLSNFQKIGNTHRNFTIIGVSTLLGMTIPIWFHDNPDIKLIDDQKYNGAIIAVFRNPNFMGGFMAFLLDNFWPGSLKERGFLFEEDDDKQHTDFAENVEVTTHPSEDVIYGIPFYPRWLAKLKLAKYIPVLPGYE